MTELHWRLFVGVPLSPAAGAALWRGLAELRALHSGARWMAPEQYHATLVFLGRTEVARAGNVMATVQRAAAGWRRVRAAPGGVGGRVGGRRGGVAWLRIGAGRRELADYSLALDDALGSQTYAAGPPRPHVTLARKVDGVLLSDMRLRLERLKAEWLFERVVVYRSLTGPAGSRYEELASFGLAA